jgi:hypothetical protein
MGLVLFDLNQGPFEKQGSDSEERMFTFHPRLDREVFLLPRAARYRISIRFLDGFGHATEASPLPMDVDVLCPPLKAIGHRDLLLRRSRDNIRCATLDNEHCPCCFLKNCIADHDVSIHHIEDCFAKV